MLLPRGRFQNQAFWREAQGWWLKKLARLRVLLSILFPKSFLEHKIVCT